MARVRACVYDAMSRSPHARDILFSMCTSTHTHTVQLNNYTHSAFNRRRCARRAHPPPRPKNPPVQAMCNDVATLSTRAKGLKRRTDLWNGNLFIRQKSDSAWRACVSLAPRTTSQICSRMCVAVFFRGFTIRGYVSNNTRTHKGRALFFDYICRPERHCKSHLRLFTPPSTDKLFGVCANRRASSAAHIHSYSAYN